MDPASEAPRLGPIETLERICGDDFFYQEGELFKSQS